MAAPPEEPIASFSTLPDALVQHIFTYLDLNLDSLRSALCITSTTLGIGRDDAVWMPFCAGRFGLTERCGPGREPVESYWHAARAWMALCRQHDPQLWSTLHVPSPLVEGASVMLTGLRREELSSLQKLTVEHRPSLHPLPSAQR